MRSITRRSTRRPTALAGKRIKSLAIHWHEDVHKWHPGQQWIWEPGGFGVFDPGINAFSIATKIFPGGLFVQSADLSFPENAQTPIAADVTFSSPEADGPLTASLDWRRSEGEEWTIDGRDRRDGAQRAPRRRRLEAAPRRRALHEDDGPGEYPDIYRTFVDLIDERRSLVDVAPLRLVADCLLARPTDERRSRSACRRRNFLLGIVVTTARPAVVTTDEEPKSETNGRSETDELDAGRPGLRRQPPALDLRRRGARR